MLKKLQRPKAPVEPISWLATVAVIAITLLVLIPVIWFASMMFRPDTAMFARPTQWLFTPTLDHFRYVIDSGFLGYMLNSFILATVSTVLVVLIGTPAAYAFARFDLKFRDDMFLFVLGTRMAQIGRA